MAQESLEQQPAADQWRAALDELEEQLHGALQTIESLRAELDGGGASKPRARLEGTAVNMAPRPERKSLREVAKETGGTVGLVSSAAAHAPFERLWERLEQERLEKQQPVESAAAAPELRGLDLLPHHYLMTVEDREQTVDLVPLHRSLQGLTGVQEVSLVSFANGVPVVSVRTDRELDLGQLGGSVTAAMDRECEVIPQGNNKIFLRLKPLPGRDE